MRTMEAALGARARPTETGLKRRVPGAASTVPPRPGVGNKIIDLVQTHSLR